MIAFHRTREAVAFPPAPVSRSETLDRVRSQPTFDLVIIGGGAHGVGLARVAALNGLKVLLLEGSDYGLKATGSASDISHGGLRYLDPSILDLHQVFEGNHARETLFRDSPHTAYPVPFRIPIGKGDWLMRLKLSLGLPIYDAVLPDPARKHRWTVSQKIPPDLAQCFGRRLFGMFEYCDGLMRTPRIVLDNLLSAREAGACTLNHSSVLAVQSPTIRSQDLSQVRFRDRLTGEEHTVRARAVANCAGPWVEQLIGLSDSPGLRFSRGTHLVFDVPWKHGALYMPFDNGRRSYFVLPNDLGTVVGTTEREVSSPQYDPCASRDEIEEIFSRLTRDLPHSGLTRENVVAWYAGQRVLVRDRGKTSGSTSKLKRRHSWTEDRPGLYTLRGGKWTSYVPTAYDGLTRIFKSIGRADRPISVDGIVYPSSRNLDAARGQFSRWCEECTIPARVRDGTWQRLGALSAYLPAIDPSGSVLGGRVLKAEALHSLRYEQCETLGDFVQRMRMTRWSGHGVAVVNDLLPILKAERPALNLDQEIREFDDRLARMREVLR